jgi:hypothetical protein
MSDTKNVSTRPSFLEPVPAHSDPASGRDCGPTEGTGDTADKHTVTITYDSLFTFTVRYVCACGFVSTEINGISFHCFEAGRKAGAAGAGTVAGTETLPVVTVGQPHPITTCAAITDTAKKCNCTYSGFAHDRCYYGGN